MVFVPLVISCLVADPDMCRPIMGYAELTEADCMYSLTLAVDALALRPDIYVGGLTCIETYLLDEEASNQ